MSREITNSILKTNVTPFEIEKTLIDIWKEVLKIDEISTYDDFFELGGYSLLATKVISRIRQLWDVEMPVNVFFESPTIEGLRSALFEQNQKMRPLLLPQNEQEDIPASYSQQYLLNFLEKFENKTLHVDLIPLRLQGSLDVESIEQAFQKLILRHHILQTYFIKKKGLWYQETEKNLQVNLIKQHLSQLPNVEKEEKLQEIIQKQWDQPFDLAHFPLFRIQLIKIDSDDHVLLITLHQSIFDGWSIEIFARELSQIYNHLAFNEPLLLEPLTVQYKDYTLWQHEWLTDARLDNELQYWKKHLEGLSQEKTFPVDKPRPLVASYQGGIYEMKLSKELIDKLYDLSKKHKMTLFMILLASLQVLLHMNTDLDEIVIGSPTANRTQKEIEGLMGLFANVLVYRFKLNKNQSFLKIMEDTRSEVLNANMHRDIPFEKVVECLSADQKNDKHPIFQIMFTLENFAPVEFRLKQLNAVPLIVNSVKTKYDISFNTLELPSGGLAVGIGYATDLYFPNTIQNLAESWNIFLQKIVQSPERAIKDL